MRQLPLLKKVKHLTQHNPTQPRQELTLRVNQDLANFYQSWPRYHRTKIWTQIISAYLKL